MDYSFVSVLGVTPQERLKNIEGFNLNHKKTSVDEANAFLLAMRNTDQPVIFHRVNGNDVFSYNVNSKGDKDLTNLEIADLKTRYDFSSLSQDAYETLLAELNMMGVLRYGQAKLVAPISTKSGTITHDEIKSYLETQLSYAKNLLSMVRAYHDPSIIAIDDLEKSIASFEKLNKIMSNLFA